MMINTFDRHLYQATTGALWRFATTGALWRFATTGALWRFATTGALWRDANTAWPRWGPTIDPCGLVVSAAR